MKNADHLFLQTSEVIKRAYAPYSHFHVGACIESASGKLYTGCNVENASYGLTICAEASAISAMVSAGETVISRLAVMVTGPGVSAPCGACRQRIHEFSTPDTVIHLGDLQGNRHSFKESDLLPHAFGPNDLIKP
jgi:cytidine deaminase